MNYVEFIKENAGMFSKIIDCMNAGVWITDEKGVVVMINNVCVLTGGMPRETVIGKSMEELIEEGYIIQESSVLKALSSGKKESIIQEVGAGGYILATSIPLYNDEGIIELVVCIEKNISDVINLENLLEQQKQYQETLKNELSAMRKIKKVEKHFDGMIAESPGMIKVRRQISNISVLDSTVLITGESGTGKEVVASMIQKHSKRAEKPFVKINCSAIPESLIESELFGYEKGAFTGADKSGKAGLFELADQGTLFLDEIGELPLPMQSKLLRVIQEQSIRRIGGNQEIKIDVRIIAATNRDLRKEVQKGNFRSDLYYRLYVIPINILPLRHRIEDIKPLAESFLNAINEQYALNKKFTKSAIDELKKHRWPGNVRELKNLIERTALLGGGESISSFQIKMAIDEESRDLTLLQSNDPQRLSLAEMVRDYEKQLILMALNECDTCSEAADMLKIDRSTISRKLRKYNIQKNTT